MSKGTPAVSFRIPPELRVMIEDELKDRDAKPLLSPWSLTDFFIVAALEKLHHAARNRKNVAEQAKIIRMIGARQ